MSQKNGPDVVWELRLQEVAESLRANNFKVDVLETLDAAVALFKDRILPELGPEAVGVAGSETVTHSGVYKILEQTAEIEFLNPYDPAISPEESVRRRKAIFACDLFITSTNALVRSGQLVNLDGLGNRVAAMIYGPEKVLLFVGRNKICDDLEAAVSRITEFAAPANCVRLERATPCVKTGHCMDCKSPQRICNAWSLIEKSNPPERIHVLLINQDLGF